MTFTNLTAISTHFSANTNKTLFQLHGLILYFKHINLNQSVLSKSERVKLVYKDLIFEHNNETKKV